LPGSLQGEPFPLADDPPNAFRMRSTPPSGSLLLNREVEQMSEDPREQTIRDLRQTIVLYRERLTALSATQSPVPSDAPPKSKAMAVAGSAWNATKVLGVVTLLLTLAGQLAAIYRPGLVGPLQALLDALGKLAQ
jgi:hypothetical protein